MTDTTAGSASSTAARLIARRLYQAGCRHAFGIPGGEVLSLLDALIGEGIAFHLCKHENAGSFMAEGTHHATGAPGVLLATIGPGLANSLNAVINAAQDQVPLIVLSGAVDAAEAATYTHQVFDQTAVMRSIAKASFSLADGAVDVITDRAVAIALADPPGPVHLDLPIALADKPQQPRPRLTVPPASPMAPAPGAMLDAARERLAQAQRPIMIAGVGAVHHHAGAAIGALCERFGMPLLTTYKGKGLVREDHPLALGGHGLSPLSDECVMPLLAEADLILLAGYDPIEMRTGWRDRWDPLKAIEFTHLPSRHGMHGASMSFVGEIKAGFAALSDGIDPQQAIWPDGQPGRIRDQLAQLFGKRPHWGPHQAFASARHALPETTVATVDSGAHRILFSQMWTCYHPRKLLQSTGFCTMGTALPLAIGHKRAQPETPVLALMGDAGCEMVLGELATLRDLAMPVIVMVMVDRALSLIELKQRRSGLAPAGVTFGATDFVAVAEAMGGIGRRITSAASLEEEIIPALERNTFTLLACEINPLDYDGAF